jgi:fatty-acyl-CoA synthase
MLGLMQNWPLTVDRIFDHANAAFPQREVVTRAIEDGQLKRTTYANVYGRAKQVTNALRERSIAMGDRVATLGWNTDRHLEAWYGAMGMGAVLHTLNPRLFPEQIAWIVNHAEDKIIFFDVTFTPIIEKIAPLLKTVQLYVAFTDAGHMPQSALPMIAYEDFIAGQATEARWGGFDENTACGLCYTSGTTAIPKACSTRIARTCCTPWRRTRPTCSAVAPAIRYCR